VALLGGGSSVRALAIGCVLMEGGSQERTVTKGANLAPPIFSAPGER
jgi:hypothetical protein